MINLKIDKYHITNDTLQYIISEKTTIKEGKHAGEIAMVNKRYFPSLAGAFIALFEKRLKESNAATLTEFKKDHDAALEWIKDNVHPEE
jgi:hypothetical protein